MKQNYAPAYADKIRGRITKDQLLNHEIELKEKRSITPETHKSRMLITDEKELSALNSIKQELIKEDLSSPFYVDEYQYKGSELHHVLRFGINKYRENLKEELIKHNLLQQEISGKALETLTNISQESNYKKFSGYIKLTVLEEQMVTYALNYLKSNNTTKVVLVDLFPRGIKANDKGLIDTKEKIIDTHTVVLYNNGKKILIIDPNNPQFSAHLSNFNPELLEATYTPNNLYKIYSRPEGSKTGFAHDKFRDCIDIAVKLAFGLNNDLNNYENLPDLMKSQTIKLITNNSVIDKFFPDIKNVSFRSKQSSDLEIIKDKNKVFEILWNKKIESEKNQLSVFTPIIKSIQESLKVTQDKLQESINNIKNNYEQELSGLDNDYFDTQI